MLVIVGTRTDAHSLRIQVGIGSESDCLFGQLDRILRISDSETGLKEENSGGVVGEDPRLLLKHRQTATVNHLFCLCCTCVKFSNQLCVIKFLITWKSINLSRIVNMDLSKENLA